MSTSGAAWGSPGDHSPRSLKDRICSRTVDYGLLGLLVLAPLPAASVYEWSILIIQLTVLVMMAAYLLMREKPRVNEGLVHALKWPRYLFLGFFIIVAVQLLPLPKSLVGILSPSAHSYLRQYAVDFSKIKFMSFSLIPSFSFQKALELLSYFLLGFLVIRTVTRRRQIYRLLITIVAVGVFEALYGLFELYDVTPRILFFEKTHNLDSVTGTFVNRNHFSGFLEMVIPLAVGLMISRVDVFSFRNLSWREKLLRFSERGLSLNLFLFASIVVMSVAIIYSNSRSGIFILLFTFLLFFGAVTVFYDRQDLKKKRVKKSIQAAFLVVIVISLYVGVDSTIQRFSPDELLNTGRPTYWANTLRTFVAYPLFGTGLGTFGALYPPLDSGREGPVVLVHAHNDYLEYLSELGLTGFPLLMGGIFLMAVLSFAVWMTRKHPEIRSLALGGIISLVAIFIHSLTDFNLQIPANLVLFSVVLSLTMVMAFFKRDTGPAERP